MIKVKRALISVSDKTGLLDFVRGLQALGIEIISTGGTATLLRNNGLSVKEVSEYTKFPEILDGRVKTLHPAIHGGLLALRENPEHMDQIKKHQIDLIDMVVVNLYPFEKVSQKQNVSLEEALENIDIGGPSMLRSAAKNFKSVAVVCNPQRYKEILTELDNNSGLLSDKVLMNLAVEVFEHTARYDGIICDFLNSRLKESGFSRLPKQLALHFQKIQDLRYGENPHQAAAFYREQEAPRGLAKLNKLNGKELSFNNLLDLNAAYEIIRDLDGPAAVVVKHNNPAGVAQDKTLAQAYKAAWACDRLSAFGGIIGFNRKVDFPTAKLIAKSGFMECIIAPEYDREALKLLSEKKNLRITQLALADFVPLLHGFDFKRVEGGILLQEQDLKDLGPDDIKVVTKIKPSKLQMESMQFGWKIIKHIKSNAIVLIKGTKTVGIGCGQTSRVDSTMTAIKKAGSKARSSVMISDAFLPKADNVLAAAKAGVKAIIQTGGSIADKEVIKAADKSKIAMVTTGIRHFKH